MALLRYDPNEHIISDAWLALDESERMGLVRQYHRRQRIRLPNETIHVASEFSFLLHLVLLTDLAFKQTGDCATHQHSFRLAICPVSCMILGSQCRK